MRRGRIQQQARAGDWRSWLAASRSPCTPEFLQHPPFPQCSSTGLAWILVGLGRRGRRKPHLATTPWGPALGGSSVFLPRGAQGVGWPCLQDLAGWGKRVQSRLPLGPEGEDLGWHRIPRLRVGPKGVWGTRHMVS